MEEKNMTALVSCFARCYHYKNNKYRSFCMFYLMIKTFKNLFKNIKYIECDFNEDWIIKIIDSGFDSSTKSYFSMLGLSYYLEKEVFKNTIITISSVMSEGSTILFDYPNNDESETEILNQKLAEGAASEMKYKYSCGDIKRICEECGLLIYENIGYSLY